MTDYNFVTYDDLSMTVDEISEKNIIIKLTKVRREKNITINQLALLTGVAHTTISRIENFIVQPSFSTIIKIAQALDYTICLENVQEMQQKDETISDFTDSTTFHLLEPIYTREFYARLKNSLKFTFYSNISTDKMVDNVFSTLLAATSSYELKNSVIANINRFKKYTSLVINEFCAGQHNLAYSLFKDALENCIDLNFFTKDMPNNLIVYRCRKKDKDKKIYNFEDMFHIPFSKRYKVSSQRYSYPGLPCLYLGSSSDVCAEELQLTPSELVTAQFEYCAPKKFKILDLTQIFDDSKLDVNKVFQNLPLVLMCSIVLKYDEPNKKEPFFRQEYIFPQLLLEYILNETLLDENKIVGIKYCSVKYDFFEEFISEGDKKLSNICNYVFPAREVKTGSEQCAFLKKVFKLISITT